MVVCDSIKNDCNRHSLRRGEIVVHWTISIKNDVVRKKDRISIALFLTIVSDRAEIQQVQWLSSKQSHVMSSNSTLEMHGLTALPFPVYSFDYRNLASSSHNVWPFRVRNKIQLVTPSTGEIINSAELPHKFKKLIEQIIKKTRNTPFRCFIWVFFYEL